MAGWLDTTFAALRVREFRILWSGTWLSFTAFFMSTVVQSVVAFELEGTNTAVGWVVAAHGIAMLTLSPLGGALADRLPKRRVVALGQGTAAGIFLVLGALVATNRITVVILAISNLMIGATFSFLGPSRQALVVDVVPDSRRGNAIALAQVANTGSRVVGPALAALFLGWQAVGASGAYASMALLYALACSLLLWLPKSRIREGARDLGVFEDLKMGLRYAATHRRLRGLLVFYTLIIMVGFPHVTLMPGLLENQLGRNATELGLLFMVSALGALASTLSLARFADTPRGPTYFAAAGLLFGLSILGLAIAPSYVGAVVAMFFIGAGSGGFQALGNALAAHESDPAFMGRVVSLTMLAFAGFGLMGLPIGLLADALGERATLALMGAAVCGFVVALSFSLWREHRHQ